MSLRITRLKMLETAGLAGLAVSLLGLPAIASALLVEGTTTAGMSFRGEVASASGDILHVTPPGSGPPLQVGIPIVDIVSLRLSDPGNQSDNLCRELETIVGLLDRLDPADVRQLITFFTTRAESGPVR